MSGESMTETSAPVGQLVDVNWKFGVATSSNSCHSLNYPYIIMAFQIRDANGVISKKTVEMSISDFQKFRSQMKEMASVMSTG